MFKLKSELSAIQRKEILALFDELGFASCSMIHEKLCYKIDIISLRKRISKLADKNLIIRVFRKNLPVDQTIFNKTTTYAFCSHKYFKENNIQVAVPLRYFTPEERKEYNKKKNLLI